VLRKLLVVAAAVAALAGSSNASQARSTGACGLPDANPLWIDFTDGTVPWGLTAFGKTGITIATPGGGLPPQFRQLGANTVYWEMRLGDTVGTTTAPADPGLVDQRAQAMFDRAVARSGCATPLMALNELNGAGTTTPWSATNAQYRANVLELVRALAAKGAHPFLLVNSEPYTGADAADWWRQVAQFSDIVSEDYFIGPSVRKLGPIAGSRRLRLGYRQSILHFTEIGIPVSRLGIMLGFQSGPGAGGREGLQPSSAWFEIVKLQTLAARQVATDLKIATVWSWGWGTYTSGGADPDKAAAACVYLWARDQSLCDGPTAAGPGFDPSLTEGQINLPIGVHCVLDRTSIHTIDIAHVAALSGDPELAFTALYERAVEQERARIPDDRVLAAEESVVDLRFSGNRAAYVAALAARHATVPTARAILSDQLRRARLEGGLPVTVPSESQIEAFYNGYPATLVRRVQVSPAPIWLGGRTTGFAIESIVPGRLFALQQGEQTTLLAADGVYQVRPLDQPLPLSAVPLALVRPAIEAALTAYARADAFERWTEAYQTRALNRVICRGDHLPQIGEVDLSTFVPFLALEG